jgi:Protein kinase domain
MYRPLKERSWHLAPSAQFGIHCECCFPSVLTRGLGVVDALQPGDPQQVGKYRLLNRLGTGGMGRVYLGESPDGLMVAVKLIRLELADNAAFRRSFALEVAAAQRVSGSFTVQVVDADPDGPQPWLVTAYVSGPSLADAVASLGPLPLEAVRILAAGLAAGLHAIHAAGIVHRDLKPSNVLLSSDGPCIIDFGISRAADDALGGKASRVVGSPGFMSPEQAEGKDVGPPADIFSFGGVLAFAASGRSPFGSGSTSVLLHRVVYGSPGLGHVPPELRSLIERCLAKEPAARPSTDELLAELGAAEPAEGWLPRHLPALWVPALRHSSAEGARLPRPIQRVRNLPADRTRPARAARPWPGSFPGGVPGPRESSVAMAGWAAALLLAVGGASAAAVLLTVGNSHAGAGHPAAAVLPLPSPDQHKHVLTVRSSDPRSVVLAYFAAINARDWHRVWRLGGDTLSPTYRSMVAGYARTVFDEVRNIRVSGDQVIVRVRAYETDNTSRLYRFEYTVQHAVITSGRVLTA